jgi:alkanesulfonate monooxygenase SsuD/methylene tetrahydromethanopterin reductase-like flavin-dependent oxidoreductase (luciferase family)
VKFNFFHLMPYTELPLEGHDWPFPSTDFDPQVAHRLFNTYIGQMLKAEECGFDWVGCNEHHFSPYGMMANCNVIGGALAYNTKNIKLAMIGNLLPLNNPIRVAEEYAMLDCISGGRLIAGLMRGIPHEYIAYNIPPSESWSRQREAIQLVIKAWTEPEPFGWEGEHYQFRSVSIWPKPLQKPHPPIIVSASTPDSAQFAAEIGAIMGVVLLPDLQTAKESIRIYKETARAHGWEPGPEHILIGMHTVIAETDEEARAHMLSAREYFGKVLMQGLGTAQGIVLKKSRYYENEKSRESWEQRHARRADATMEDAIDKGTILCGSPETVVKQIKRIHGELGHGIFNFTVKVGNLPDEVVAKGMRLFKERVHPHVKDL